MIFEEIEKIQQKIDVLENYLKELETMDVKLKNDINKSFIGYDKILKSHRNSIYRLRRETKNLIAKYRIEIKDIYRKRGTNKWK